MDCVSIQLSITTNGLVHPNPFGWLVETLEHDLAQEKRNGKTVSVRFDSDPNNKQQYLSKKRISAIV
jgi:hypothetical protein